ncbi:type II secretion system F family protein [Robbsia sp. Bb-Pol-6]|uniref:Type II secretion system F family protein n=1 Tax=Robbsia betulipollinis TaxID=2981849 RepID=A0ABT3ZSH8_9BURK|nr:type II secretion system F family protein [Robbsia betulipollinis]MCY0389483.1 type II secretion system F family protein [Robbsia betulipollinis]
MSGPNVDRLLNLIMLLALFAGLAIWWMTKHGSRSRRIAMRLQEATVDMRVEGTASGSATATPGPRQRLLAYMARLGENIPLFDAAYRIKLQREMVRSGYRGNTAVSLLLAVKLCFGLACAATTIMLGSSLPVVGPYPVARGIAMMGAFIVGMIVPEYMMTWRARRRRALMAACLPDALDLLIICTNAGNSFPVSIRRVADELATICPPLSDEFSLTADELHLSGDTNRALHGLAERIDLPSIRALITTLTQSMRYGTPITQALRTLSRTERLTHVVALEEKAAKLAPKMVVPMLLFILPPVVAISAGPAVIQLLEFMNRK